MTRVSQPNSSSAGLADRIDLHNIEAAVIRGHDGKDSGSRIWNVGYFMELDDGRSGKRIRK